jgi:hypothetical protein
MEVAVKSSMGPFRENFWRIVCCGALAAVLGGCLPPAANLQDARVMDKGQVRLTGFWSNLESAGAGGEELADEYGGLIGIGGGSETEFQLRIERLALPDEGEGYEFISFGPKIGVIEDRLAVLVPVGVNVGEDVEWLETIQIHPALLGSIPLSRNFEINSAAKLIFPINGSMVIWLNFGLGFGISTDLERWAILPEVGYSRCLDESEIEPVFNYGIALALYTGD